MLYYGDDKVEEIPYCQWKTDEDYNDNNYNNWNKNHKRTKAGNRYMPLTWFARELTSEEPTELKENATSIFRSLLNQI